jgi:ABC-type multidrug transport system fused ATPase/permease subunit
VQTLVIIISTCVVVTAIGKFISSLIFMSINRNMHTKVVASLIHTHMAFFDENTSGRIMNRMSTDVKVLDFFVFEFLECIDYNIKCLFSVIIIIISSPFTIIIIILQLIYVFWLSKRVLRINIDTMRLKQITNSPIVSLI